MSALTIPELATRLDALLNPVLSSRRTALPLAEPLSPLPRAQQDFILRWAEVIARTNYELAYQFAEHAPAALADLDDESAEAWIIAAVDVYDREGLYPGTQAFKDHARFALRPQRAAAVTFEQAAPILTHFVRGLSGRALTLASAPVPWTDSDTIYLPPCVAVTRDARGNFLIYKLITTLLWAQSRYGTFNSDLNAATQHHSDPARALAWLNFLESVRLQARIDQALPGLAGDAQRLYQQLGIVRDDSRYASLVLPRATVSDSIALLNTVDLSTEAPNVPWLGVLRPAEVSAVRKERLEREKSELQAALAQLLQEHNAASDDAEFSVEIEASSPDGATQFKLELNNQPIAPPEPVRNLINAILQDLGEVPGEWLKPDDTAHDSEEDSDVQQPPEPAHHYDEWDYQRGHYRKAWCALREVTLAPGDEAFVTITLNKYAPQVRQLKRTFEMLRGEDKLMKRMPHGEDIDLDALIAARADLRSGRELSERLHVKRHRNERSLAAIFMVDMSGSTKGWVNEAEREALVMLAEALEILGDRYAIYGFSGMTRKRCEIYPVKRFDEAYSADVRARIAGIAPQDYTRMGAAIRHATARFEKVQSRRRLLLLLSDGRPEDYDDGGDRRYLHEDTRMAVKEAVTCGVHPYCITVDTMANQYLPQIFGPGHYMVLDHINSLPNKLPEIYLRLRR